MWADFKAAGVVEVHPVVVLWGSGNGPADGPDQVLVDGVAVVRGPAAARWRSALLLEEPVLSHQQVDQAWAALDRQAHKRDALDLQPLPPSLGQLASRTAVVAAAGAAGAAGFLAAAELLTVAGSLLLWAPGCLLLAAGVAPLRRRERARLPALAWQTGLGGALLMAAAAALVDVLI